MVIVPVTVIAVSEVTADTTSSSTAPDVPDGIVMISPTANSETNLVVSPTTAVDAAVAVTVPARLKSELSTASAVKS